MAATPAKNVLIVPQRVAARLSQMVAAGEFPTFERAALAMLDLGIAQHDGHVLSAGGPAPPSPRRDIPPPGPGGQPGPRVRSARSEAPR